MGALNLAAEGSSGRYLDWGVVQISVTNLLIVLAMIVVFLLAVLVPFPGHRHDDSEEKRS